MIKEVFLEWTVKVFAIWCEARGNITSCGVDLSVNFDLPFWIPKTKCWPQSRSLMIGNALKVGTPRSTWEMGTGGTRPCSLNTLCTPDSASVSLIAAICLTAREACGFSSTSAFATSTTWEAGALGKTSHQRTHYFKVFCRRCQVMFLFILNAS